MLTLTLTLMLTLTLRLTPKMVTDLDVLGSLETLAHPIYLKAHA